MRGTALKISLPRRLIIDLMRASRGVPLVALRRTIDVRPLLEARDLVAKPPGWTALFVKAFSLVAREQPTFRTLYIPWPWPHFYELPRSVALVATARIVDGEGCMLPQKVSGAEDLPLGEVEALIRTGKNEPIEQVPAFRKLLRLTRLPWPLRRLFWAVGLHFGRQRGNWFGNFGVTSVAGLGGGELEALSPGPFILTFGAVNADQTINVVLRWDHRITDGAPIAKFMTRLEQVLNTEIAAEVRSQRLQAAANQGSAAGT